MRDQIDNYSFLTEIADAVSEECPFVPFGFLDIVVTDGPIIGWIQPEQAE
jgi:hypothetical protein